MSEAEGGTQATESELPEGLYADVIGSSETPDDLTPDEPETDGEESADPEEAAETPKPQDATETNWEEKYRELESFVGKQGRETGERIKALEAQLAKQQPKEDPFDSDPTLKSLDPSQKQMLMRAASVVLEQRLGDVGLTLDELPQLKQAVQQQTEEYTRTQINNEVNSLKEKFGEETFNRYIPQMQQLATRYPNLGPSEIFKMAAFEDLQKGQSERAKALEAERKQRAASADFGNERPAKSSNGKLTGEALKKLSAKGNAGTPSPRLKALLAEARRELGG